MKKDIIHRLMILILLSATLSFVVNYYIETDNEINEFYSRSEDTIQQIAEKIEENNSEIDEVVLELMEENLSKAKVLSEFITHDPDIIYDNEKQLKYMELLLFDEVHFFNEDGVIFAGTTPAYYGVSMDSGEQIQFFLPMLEDKDLELAQELKPNTSDGKVVQYAAVWNKEHNVIVQVGHEQPLFEQVMEDLSLTRVFSFMITDPDMGFLAYDKSTGEIFTDSENSLGSNIPEDMTELDSKGRYIHDAEAYYFYTKEIDEIVLGLSMSELDLLGPVYSSIVLNSVLFTLNCAAIIIIILLLLNNIIIKPIHSLVFEMKKIGTGNYDEKVKVNNTREFAYLSDNINELVGQLTSHSKRLDRLFSNITVPIAIFEYNEITHKFSITGKLFEVLHIDEDIWREIESDGKLINERLKQIVENPLDTEQGVYAKKESNHTYYYKIKFYKEDDNKLWWIIIDVTGEVHNQEKFRNERDIDHLTSLYTRWGLRERIDKLLENGVEPKSMALIMLDLDNLKFVNDTYGHECGDDLISTAADILKNSCAPYKFVSRIGGDEFVIVFYNASSEEEIVGYVNDLYEKIDKAYITTSSEEKVKISFSGGYVFYDADYNGYEKMLAAADKAMYTVKRTKKGRIIPFDKSME